MAASFLALALALAAPAARGHGREGGSPPRAGREGVAQAEGHIWGRCDRWDRDFTGCSLQEGATCASRLSAGPGDADTELRLGNLTASTAEQEVHVQWWAARASQAGYDPLSRRHYKRCSVFEKLRQAYPKYYDADFNGGNVRVNEAGEAVIKVRAPSAYRVYNFVAYPHIHLRVCRGSNHVESKADAVVFTPNGPLVKGAYNGGASVVILEARTQAQAHNPGSTGAVEASEVAQEIEDARTALDLDALEFSPVYQCLLDARLFSHFTSDCVDGCVAGAAMRHGQCVRPEGAGAAVTLLASWQLQVECGEPCWEDKRNFTLHHLRLAVADQLDIPFQEVTNVRLGLAQAAARRLSGLPGDGVRTAYLLISATTRRVPEEEGRRALSQLLADPEDASLILGLRVHSAVLLDGPRADGGILDLVRDADDPYSPAYEALEPRDSGAGGSQLPIWVFPVAAAVGAVAVAVVALCAWLVCRRRSRKRRSEAAAAANAEAKAKVAEPEPAAEASGLAGKPAKPAQAVQLEGDPAEPEQAVRFEASQEPEVRITASL